MTNRELLDWYFGQTEFVVVPESRDGKFYVCVKEHRGIPIVANVRGNPFDSYIEAIQEIAKD